MSLFDYSNRKNLPAIRVTLTLDDGKMQFDPSFEDIRNVILFVVEQITSTLQTVNFYCSFSCL
jgi:hypothetical protein